MENDYKQQIENYFKENMPQIKKVFADIIAINSVKSAEQEGMPYGRGSHDALEYAENLLKGWGFEVKNFGFHAIRAEYMPDGADKVKLGVLGHLDTVSVGDGWDSNPFELTEKDGYFFGRGVIDDKGPSVAAMFALKCIKDLGIPLSGGVRLIFGGDEEDGCHDIEYYQQQEKFPPCVFTPDGSFPVLNCEKGMVHLKFSAPFENTNSNKIISIDGGKVINAVCEKCTVSYSLENTNFKDSKVYGGRASHASRPENGDNAITKFLSEFKDINPLLGSLAELFPHGEFNGSSCGLGFSDKISGEMTCALTMLNLCGDTLSGGIDIRFPIDRTYEEISGIIKNALEQAGFKIDECEGMQPHYVDENSEFVQSLLAAYEQVMGEKGYCIAEGGITYVHNTEGGVAFGAEFPWEDNHMHGANERISIDTFSKNLLLYTNAIANVCR